MHAVRLALACAAIGVLAGLPAAAIADTLVGNWVLNHELTRQAQPVTIIEKNPLGGVRTSSSVSWGGIPIPIPGSGNTKEVSSAPSQDPNVLRCSQMSIELVGKDIHVNYADFGIEKLKPGSFRGTKTTFKPSKLTSRYETTTRKVTKTYVLTKEGRLHATVKLNPKQGKTLVHHRVFDRVN